MGTNTIVKIKLMCYTPNMNFFIWISPLFRAHFPTYPFFDVLPVKSSFQKILLRLKTSTC